MNLWRRAMHMFGFGTEKKTIVDEAIDRSRAVSAKADEINATLSAYLESPDPFRLFAVDVYENTQERRLHRGPLP